MKTHISPLVTRIAVVTGLALGAFALSAVADWSAPPPPGPPSCTAGQSGCDAPINVGSILQTKTGPLSINNLLTVGNSFAGAVSLLVPNGTVGIGTANPDTTVKLDVETGAVKTGGGLIIDVRASDPASPVTGQMWLINP